jgi:hypothetical protein
MLARFPHQNEGGVLQAVGEARFFRWATLHGVKPERKIANAGLGGCAERQQRTRLHYLKFPDLRENTGNYRARPLPAC